jgi:hypothetical protein
VEEHGKDTRILEWFRPPERKTLRPLVRCIPYGLEKSLQEPVRLQRTFSQPPRARSNERALPFIGSRVARTLSGVSTGGPGDTLNNVHTGAFNATNTEILRSSSFL